MARNDKDTSLSPVQQQVIDLLVSGHSKTEAAAAAGVDRTTLWRWQQSDPAFIAGLNQTRKDLAEANFSRLASLVGQAVDVLENILDGDDNTIRLRAAALILRQAGSAWQRVGPVTTKAAEADIRHRELLDNLF